jgi:hypothetical protein
MPPNAWNASAAGLVEQIDTLSGIAGAFSNFAQLPKARPEPLDLAAGGRGRRERIPGHARPALQLRAPQRTAPGCESPTANT